VSLPPLVSICIPTYNAEAFIAEAIAAALAQTYAPIEIIISDDGSSDRTVEIAKQLLDGKGTGFKLSTHERFGIAANWNTCIAMSEGKYIKFLFQDDTIAPDCVAQMVELAEQDPEIGLVFARREIINSDDTQLDRLYVDITKGWTNLSAIQPGRSLLADPKLLEPPFNKIGEPTAVLIARAAFEKVGLFDTTLMQVLDLDMWLRIMLHYKIGYIDRSLAGFRVHRNQQSIQNARSGASWLDDWRLQFKMLGDPSYSSVPEDLKRSVVARCSEHIGQTYTEIDSLRSQAIDAYQRLEETQKRMQAEVEQLRAQYWQTNEQLSLTQAHLEQTRAQIAAMESSKFWQLRAAWLRIKRALGLKAEE
jgi:cellulose synthase/poly-beta-1,6-N-acetylglucosamine synthase-like glycosyltransferase